MATVLGQRISQKTRGRILALLRIRPWTVDELASELRLTDNAVRPHLLALERDGLVMQTGVRRGEGAGKPATVYELHPEAEPLLSRAYAPVLSALLEVLSEELVPREVRSILRETGKRLAATIASRPKGNLQARARGAADALTALGGAVDVEERRGFAVLRGVACPLATAAKRSPYVCAAVESLVAEISGATVTERCDRSDRPHCCFELRIAS